MKITVVSLNPSIDWQLTTPQFVYGGLNRVVPGKRYPSGKGINVCAALANLGQSPLCTGFNYYENGSLITDALDEWGLQHDFVMEAGTVRTNIKLYDASTNEMTELNQPGAKISKEKLVKLYNKIKGLDDSILVLSGSMPAGVPSDAYQQLCTAWPGLVILDTEGEALRLALSGEKPPFCIKPNLYELEHSFQIKLTTHEEIVAFCKKLIVAHKVNMICVSMGADGAMLVTATSAFFMPAQKLSVKGLQGAGDAMVAGIAYGLTQSVSEAELLKMAMAAAAASVIRKETLMCTRKDYDMYMGLLPDPKKI